MHRCSCRSKKLPCTDCVSVVLTVRMMKTINIKFTSDSGDDSEHRENAYTDIDMNQRLSTHIVVSFDWVCSSHYEVLNLL